MLRYFDKTIDRLEWSDIEQFCTDLKSKNLNSESSYLELKKEIEEQAKWTNASKFSEKGKGQVLKEICAFANGDGGVLIIGVCEKSFQTYPIANVKDFTDRVISFARDNLDPPLLSIDAFEIIRDGNEGVCVVEVRPSPKAPHRVDGSSISSKINRNSYIRTKTESSPMSMQQIHDLVRTRDLGILKSQKTIAEYKEKNQQGWLEESPGFRFGIIGIPVAQGETTLPDHPNLFSKSCSMKELGFGGTSPCEPSEAWTQRRPILRGRQWTYVDRIHETIVLIEISSDGKFSIEYIARKPERRHQISLRSLFGGIVWAACRAKNLNSELGDILLSGFIWGRNTALIGSMVNNCAGNAKYIPFTQFPETLVSNDRSAEEILQILFSDFVSVIGIDKEELELENNKFSFVLNDVPIV